MTDPIQNPEPLGYPWEAADGADDPEARVLSQPCGCYQRVDGESVLCEEHLAELNGALTVTVEDPDTPEGAADEDEISVWYWKCPECGKAGVMPDDLFLAPHGAQHAKGPFDQIVPLEVSAEKPMIACAAYLREGASHAGCPECAGTEEVPFDHQYADGTV